VVVNPLPQGHLTVIAAAINVTNILARNKNIDIIQLGGFVRISRAKACIVVPDAMRIESSAVIRLAAYLPISRFSSVGNYAEKMLENFSCSKLFMGVDGIDLDYGLTTTNMMEANLNQVMIQAAQKVVVMADSSKFGRRGFGKICDLDAVDHIITDKYVPSKNSRGIA